MDNMTTLKTCTGCHKEKEVSEFRKHKLGKNGLDPACKDCRYLYNHYRKNEPRILAQNREKASRYRANNKEKLSVKTKEMRRTKKGKARRMIEVRLRRGTIMRQPCVVCKRFHGTEVKAQAHHCDYNDPLNVMWLCVTHHAAWHSVFKAEE
jgi:hypothetical protein